MTAQIKMIYYYFCPFAWRKLGSYKWYVERNDSSDGSVFLCLFIFFILNWFNCVRIQITSLKTILWLNRGYILAPQER